MALDRDLVVVMGDRRYRVERSWGETSGDAPLRLISSIAVDARGRVYAYQRAEPPVVVFEPDGRVHATWGEDRIADPHGLTIAPDGRVLLVDRDAHQVLVFTPEGEQVGAIGTRHSPRFQAPFNHPTGVAVAPDGEIYVSDGYGNSVVHRFAADGTHRGDVGSSGKRTRGVHHARTPSSSTGRIGFSSPTARTTASSYSTGRGGTWGNGATSTTRWTSSSTTGE